MNMLIPPISQWWRETNISETFSPALTLCHAVDICVASLTTTQKRQEVSFMLKYLTFVLYVYPVVLLGVSGCEPTASTPDVQYVLPDNCHEEIVACEWTTWTGTEQEPDPWTCFEGEYFEYAWQEGCPDDDPSSPYCDGRAAKQQSRDGLACAACTSNENEIYWGYPEIFASCPASNLDCEEQPVPSWKWLRVAVCN